MHAHRHANRDRIARAHWLLVPALVGASAHRAAAESATHPAVYAMDLLQSAAHAYQAALAESPALRAVDQFLASEAGALPFISVALLLTALLVVTRRRRASGDLTLRLRFPEEVDGDFTVQLVRLRGRSARRPRTLLRTGVERETQWSGLAPGAYQIEIRGPVRARIAGTELARIEERLDVRIQADDTHSLEHTLRPLEAPMEFRVRWDREPANDVGLGLAHASESVRYASSGGVVRMGLPVGPQTLVIGSGDRVVERTIEVTRYEPTVVPIDLADASGLVFKGCPPAVPAFLQGDLDRAARALERDGQDDVASLLRARMHQSQGRTAEAAEALERAGHAREAALLRREISDFDRAAHLFEDVGELRAAAEMYESAEDWPAAARAYAALEAWPEAARCFEAANEPRGLIGALEGQRELLRAAALATEIDDHAQAIRLLQQVRPEDEAYGRAGELLALAFEQEGHLDLAVRQLERCLTHLPADESAPSLELHLSELLSESGETDRALEILEVLRDRDPTYPGVASRIEHVRKLRAASQAAIPRSAGATTAGEFTPPPGATAFVADDRYEILEQVGRGGMGLVYKAKDRRLGRTIALKRMPENLRDHPTAVQLFLGEAQAAARMNHPNIVTLYDADQENGHFFITMELLEGLPLNRILRDRTRFAPRDTARLGLQICAGLQYAHEQGIVHRDIKTANLFITRDRILKIMDFGLAKILEAVRESGETVIAGTPDYMAPEQSTGQVVDGRTDLYALGVTLFEISTGRLPFPKSDAAHLHATAPRPDPSAGIEDYPDALARLIQRLMAIDPQDRPASAAAVAEALQAIVEAD